MKINFILALFRILNGTRYRSTIKTVKKCSKFFNRLTQLKIKQRKRILMSHQNGFKDMITQMKIGIQYIQTIPPFSQQNNEIATQIANHVRELLKQLNTKKVFKSVIEEINSLQKIEPIYTEQAQFSPQSYHQEEETVLIEDARKKDEDQRWEKEQDVKIDKYLQQCGTQQQESKMAQFLLDGAETQSQQEEKPQLILISQQPLDRKNLSENVIVQKIKAPVQLQMASPQKNKKKSNKHVKGSDNYSFKTPQKPIKNKAVPKSKEEDLNVHLNSSQSNRTPQRKELSRVKSSGAKSQDQSFFNMIHLNCNQYNSLQIYQKTKYQSSGKRQGQIHGEESKIKWQDERDTKKELAHVRQSEQEAELEWKFQQVQDKLSHFLKCVKAQQVGQFLEKEMRKSDQSSKEFKSELLCKSNRKFQENLNDDYLRYLRQYSSKYVKSRICLYIFKD